MNLSSIFFKNSGFPEGDPLLLTSWFKHYYTCQILSAKCSEF